MAKDIINGKPTGDEKKPKAEAVLDHFKIWKITTIEFEKQVKLEGQFDKKKPTRVSLENVEWLANPVKKNGGVVLHKDAHLLGYFIKQPEKPAPKRWVKLFNQFGEAEWDLTDPSVLLVPASKVFSGTPPAPPTVIDHFECYLVDKPKSKATNIILVDQFDEKRDKKEEIKELEPAFFCVPVSKNGKKKVNPDAHLALYDITPHTTLDDPFTVKCTDQFGDHDVEVNESIMLAVPTDKLDWKEK